MTQETFTRRLDTHGSPLSQMDTEILTAFLNDPALAAFALSVEMASRGLDAGGNWVGFKAATEQHRERTATND